MITVGPSHLKYSILLCSTLLYFALFYSMYSFILISLLNSLVLYRGLFPGLWALLSEEERLQHLCQWVETILSFLSFFLFPIIEAVVFRYQIDETLRKAHLTSIHAFLGTGRGGKFCRSNNSGLHIIIPIGQANTFSSANIYDTNNLSFSPKNYLGN